MSEKITVTSETTLSNSFVGETIQVCVVSRDIRRTMEGYVKLGIGPWRVYTFSPDTVINATYRGKPEKYSMRLALTMTGGTMWEIIQPLDGPSIYKEFLEAHGEGIHHVAFNCPGMSMEQRDAEFAKRGAKLIQSGVWRGVVPYAYYETEGLTTTTFETFIIPTDKPLPDPEEWYPAAPPK